jgi:hypothetical protein
MVECDRLALRQPILGLYGQIYAGKLAADAARGKGTHVAASAPAQNGAAAAEEAISPEKLLELLSDPRIKARMFPRTFMLTRNKRRPVKTKLFGDIIAQMEADLLRRPAPKEKVGGAFALRVPPHGRQPERAPARRRGPFDVTIDFRLP